MLFWHLQYIYIVSIRKKLSGTNLVAMYCQFYCPIIITCLTAFPILTNFAEIIIKSMPKLQVCTFLRTYTLEKIQRDCALEQFKKQFEELDTSALDNTVPLSKITMI